MKKAEMLRLFMLSVLAFSLFVPAASSQSTPDTPADFARAYREFKTNYEKESRQHGIVGSRFFFIRDNQVIAKELYGLANIELNRAVDEDTIYHWASITKTFTGIAIMQLRDRGLLKLDDPVIKYLPELKAAHNPYGDMGDITIRHLMTHSAGFRNPTWGSWRDDSKDWQPFEPP